MKKVITIQDFSSAIKLSIEEATRLGIDTSKDEVQGSLKTFGPWDIPVSYRALCVSAKYDHYTCTEKTIYGIRTMTNVRQDGYELEGCVSVKGKKYSCFTSSDLFEVEGKLISVATIHARIR